MRPISFLLTTDQVRAGTKTVTRRLGWRNLKPGTRLMGAVKCQGLKKGEKIQHIRPIEVVRVAEERLTNLLAYNADQITGEMAREGFPGMSANEFIKMFCDNMRCHPSDIVTRIEFKYVEPLP